MLLVGGVMVPTCPSSAVSPLKIKLEMLYSPLPPFKMVAAWSGEDDLVKTTPMHQREDMSP